MSDPGIEYHHEVLDQIIGNYDSEVDQFLRGCGEDMVSDIKESFGSSPAGRTYQHGTVSHVASQPGYPPNVDTGALRASIRLVKVGKGEFRIEDGVEYGIIQELGGENLDARPFIRPVFEKWRKKFIGRARDKGLLHAR